MGRKAISESGLVAFNVRIPADMAEELDEEVAAEQLARPGRVYTRSDLVREILYAHVAARKPKKRKVKR